MYWSITKPFAEARNSKKYSLFLLVIWTSILILVALFVYVFPKKMWLPFQTIASVIAIIAYVFMCFAHYKVNKEVRNMQEAHNQSNSFSDVKTIGRTVKMSRSVLLSFGFCYIPYIVLVLCRAVVGDSVILKLYIKPWCDIIGLFNPLFDPILYCLQLKSVRNAVFQTLFCRKTVNDVTFATMHQRSDIATVHCRQQYTRK